MTRRKFLLSSAAGVFGVPSYALGLEPRWLDRTSHAIKIPGRHLITGCRILHLSDLHASPFVSLAYIESAIESGLAAKPDLICLTGDFVTHADPFDEAEYVRILRRLSNAAPTFACLGNHDGGVWSIRVGGFEDTSVVKKLLADSKVSLLHNESRIIEVRGQSLYLAGVGDLWSGQVETDAPFAEIPDNRQIPSILLAHNPDTKDELADRPWDLMLSGHTHGGQVIIPMFGPRFAPVRDKRFVAGLVPWNGRQVYVTRGVGNIGGVRWNCRPEVSLLDLTS